MEKYTIKYMTDGKRVFDVKNGKTKLPNKDVYVREDEIIHGNIRRNIMVVAVKDHTLKDKQLFLGHAICHPEDKYDSKIAFDMAFKRALSNEPVLTSRYSRMLSEHVVSTIINYHIRYVKENLVKYINK